MKYSMRVIYCRRKHDKCGLGTEQKYAEIKLTFFNKVRSGEIPTLCSE